MLSALSKVPGEKILSKQSYSSRANRILFEQNNFLMTLKKIYLKVGGSKKQIILLKGILKK
jgi:hypothetical protein